MGILFLFLLVFAPYALLRYRFQIDGPLALSVSLLMMPLTAFGFIVIASMFGMSGTGAIGMIFMVMGFVLGVPVGLVLLITHSIFWRKRP